MDATRRNYSLLDEPWIPVLWTDATPERVGIRDVLRNAGSIRQIAASNPMDNVATLRFLLAVLHWCKPTLSDAERGLLESAEGIPEEWLRGYLGPPGRGNPAFDLLGDVRRFYQDRPVGTTNERPIGDLLQEFPTGTSIAHFRHVRDGEYGLCPACCAIGIVRYSSFATAYGGGRYTSAVNGPAPAYAIPQGTTLLQTMLLNWPEGPVLRRDPPWLSDRAPTEDELNVVNVFAWRSRRLWLGEQSATDEPCSCCGRPARVIRRLAFTGDWKPPFLARGTQKKFWDHDPHLVFEEVSAKTGETDEGTELADSGDAHETAVSAGRERMVTTVGFPSPGSRVGTHARFWRRVRLASLSHGSVRNRSNLPPAVSVSGPFANKGLYQDATTISLPTASPAIADRARQGIESLNRATDGLTAVLRQSTPNPKREHPNRRAALDAWSPSLETHLREDYENWLRSPGIGDQPAVGDRAVRRLASVTSEVVASTTPGSPLRRREAILRALEALDRALHKLAGAGGNATNSEAVGKPKRGQRKRGRA